MFDINDRVGLAAANRPEADTDSLVAAVYAELTEEEREHLLFAAIERAARRYLRPARAAPAPATRPVPDAPSAKVTAIRDWWAGFVATPVTVGVDTKPIGDCTVGDLATLSDTSRDSAIRHAANADRFDALARQMRRTGARTVRELPREKVKLALAK